MSDHLKKERREYQYADLDRTTLRDNPFEQFDSWLKEAIDQDITDPTAMTLSTVDAEGRPWSRIVLLKGVDPEGFHFYTNYQSQKGREIEGNPRVSLLFPWLQLDRQVIVGGTAKKMTEEESTAYFASRPRESQLAANVSHQSEEVPSREALDERFMELQKQYDGVEIPKPDHWGGFVVIPDQFEFWQGGEHRLHDRFRFTKDGDGWHIARLSP